MPPLSAILYNKICDDSARNDAKTAWCEYGTDCADCGPRSRAPSPPPPAPPPPARPPTPPPPAVPCASDYAASLMRCADPAHFDADAASWLTAPAAGKRYCLPAAGLSTLPEPSPPPTAPPPAPPSLPPPEPPLPRHPNWTVEVGLSPPPPYSPYDFDYQRPGGAAPCRLVSGGGHPTCALRAYTKEIRKDYCFVVQAENAHGLRSDLKQSGPVRYCRDEPTPGAARIDAQMEQGTPRMAVRWNSFSDNCAPIVGYTVATAPHEGGNLSAALPRSVGGNESSTLFNLTTDGHYVGRVCAINAAGVAACVDSPPSPFLELTPPTVGSVCLGDQCTGVNGTGVAYLRPSCVSFAQCAEAPALSWSGFADGGMPGQLCPSARPSSRPLPPPG